jgi:hypothetical protein
MLGGDGRYFYLEIELFLFRNALTVLRKLSNHKPFLANPFLYGNSTAKFLKRQNPLWERVLEHVCGLDGGRTTIQK